MVSLINSFSLRFTGLSRFVLFPMVRSLNDSLNLICSCGNDYETSAHFLLHFPHYSNERSTFLNTIRNINRNIFDKNDL